MSTTSGWHNGSGSGRCVHQVAERRARECPDAVALIHDDTGITFAELDERAERVATSLRRRGVLPGDVVAILLQRTARLGEAVLGVLKAGATYLPLDVTLPAGRLEVVLANSGAVTVVCDAASAPRVAAHDRLVIDRAAYARPAPAARTVTSPANPLAPAYVIYTSGSTGTPKGVVLSHRVLMDLLDWHLAELGPPRGPVLQYAPLSFDASIHELLVAWEAGVPAVVAGETERYDPTALASLIVRAGIRRAILPGLMLDQLVRELDDTPVLLDDVIVTGEQLQVTPAIRAFFTDNPGVRLHNHYGPSETHVVTALTLPSDPATWPVFPSIGSPISGVSIRFHDERFEPVPPGTVGEICIGGPLADGYLADPTRTAERFVADPAGDGARLYRTGDLGRLLASGDIEFLGRADRQVKVRGFRIELGDVEAAVLGHPGVAAVAVTVTGAGVRTGLAAFVVAKGTPPPEAELRATVQAALPYYMVPASFVVVDELPRTENGKLDTAAVAAAARRVDPAPPEAADWTPTMTAVAELWASLLPGLDRPIEASDTFFELGGTSLLAPRVVATAEQTWGARLPLRLVFEAPSLTEFADAVEARFGEVTSLAERATGDRAQSPLEERIA